MKKLLSAAIAAIMLLALCIPAFAFEGEADIALYVGNSVNWVNDVSETVKVNADGEYTLKLSGISVDESAVTVIYIKDKAVQDELQTASNLPEGLQIVTKELKINGNAIELSEGYATTLTDAGVFDVCWYNIWATSCFSTLGMKDITDVEVTFEVISSGAGEEAAPEATVEPVTAPEADKPADAAKADTAKTEAPAKTGIALAILPMAIAMAAAVASKKR